MKTLYLTDCNTNIIVDTETNYVSTMRSEDRYDTIRNVFYAEEPIHVVYNSGECHEEIDAKKGDFIILFYNNRFNKYRIDTIRSKQWSSNVKNRRTIEQKEAEAWAARNAEKEQCECDCCTNCCGCDICSCVNEPAKPTVIEKIKSTVKKAVKKTKKG